MNDLFRRALELPQPERAALAHRLLLSLEPIDFDPDSEAAWAAEIEARLAAVARGEFSASDWRDALARMRHTLSQGRSP